MYYYLVDEEPSYGQLFQRRFVQPHPYSSLRTCFSPFQRPTLSWPTDSFGFYSPISGLMGPTISPDPFLEGFNRFPRTVTRSLASRPPRWSAIWSDDSEDDADESVAFRALPPSALSLIGHPRQQKKKRQRKQKSILELLEAKLRAAKAKASTHPSEDDHQPIKKKKPKSEEQGDKPPAKEPIRHQFVWAIYDPAKGWTVLKARSSDSEPQETKTLHGEQTTLPSSASEGSTAPPPTPVPSSKDTQPGVEVAADSIRAADDGALNSASQSEPQHEVQSEAHSEPQAPTKPEAQPAASSEAAPSESIEQPLPSGESPAEVAPVELAANALPEQSPTALLPTANDVGYDFCEQEHVASPPADATQASGLEAEEATVEEEEEEEEEGGDAETEGRTRDEHANDDALEGMFAQELAILETVGFGNRARSLSVLVQHFGSAGTAALPPAEKQLKLQAVISQLLQPQAPDSNMPTA